jgi:tetratricopeptide (TPR) repeat protein
MKAALRIALVVVLALQAWHAVVLTRYERALQGGALRWNAWDAEGALPLFGRAREIDDSSAEVWRRIGDMALNIHDYPGQVEGEHDPEEMLDRAWEGYAGAVLRRPIDSWSWTGLAEVSLNRAELDEARRGLDLARLERRRRGILDRDRATALTAARLAVWLKPAGFQELDVLASIYESLGEIDEARRIYSQSARMMPVASFHVWGTGRALPAPLYQAVLAGLEEGIEKAPAFERSILHVEVSWFARAHGDYETSIRHAEAGARGARTANQTYRSYWELAQTLQKTGRFDDAIDAVETARENMPDRAALAGFQGSLEFRAGRMADACAHLREGLRRAPDDAGLRMQTARACESAGEPRLAEQILREGFVLPTDNPALARAVLELYRREGSVRLARYTLDRWIQEHPDREDFRRWSGQTGTRDP